MIIKKSGGNVFTTATQTLSGKTITGEILTAGTTALAPLQFNSGTNVTSPVAGAVEYDGAGFYATANTTQGREAWMTTAQYMMTSDGSASGVATITDFFPATSSFSTVTNGIYEIIFEVWYLKTTAGTMAFTLTNTQAYTSASAQFLISPVGGIGSFGNCSTSGALANTTAAWAMFQTNTLTDATNAYALIRIMAQCGTAGNIRLRGTPSAGTFTARANSRYTVRRWTGNVGTFVA